MRECENAWNINKKYLSELTLWGMEDLLRYEQVIYFNVSLRQRFEE